MDFTYSDLAALLKNARNTISDEKKWTQGGIARDSKGREIDILERHTEACQFCAVGAVHKAVFDVYPDDNEFETYGQLLITEATQWLDDTHIVDGFADEITFLESDLIPCAHLNENSDHKTVLKMFDEAIETLSELALTDIV